MYMVKLTKFEHKMLSHVGSIRVPIKSKNSNKESRKKLLCNDLLWLSAIII